MSVISRKVPSVPVRTSVETWTAIIDLLTATDHEARKTLQAVTNIAAMLISEEYTRDTPIVVVPAIGDRIRIYTMHGTNAIEADRDPIILATWPLAAPGWTLSLPCGIDDIDDVAIALQDYPSIDARDTTAGISVEAALAAPRAHGVVSINYDEMERP
jgi:hypothetical protein